MPQITTNSSTFNGPLSDIVPAAIRTFETRDEAGNVISPPDLEAVRTWALATVRQLAAARIEASDDGLVNIQYVYDEVRRYDAYLSDPANEPTPNATRYKVASEVATALSVSLTAVLDNFRSRWIASYTAAAAIVAERQRVVTALNAPGITVAEIEAVLAGISWG